MASYDNKLLNGSGLTYLWSKITAKFAAKTDLTDKITDPVSKSINQVLQYNGNTWVAANPPSGGVSSFNSRTGAVVPMAGDYTAAQVGVSLSNGTITVSGSSITPITDLSAYSTTAQMNQAINDAIGQITGFQFEIVQALPPTGDANKIYLVLKSQGETGNVYTEYAWINNAWEMLGDTSVDFDTLTNSDIDAITA